MTYEINKIALDKVCPLSYEVFLDVTSLAETGNNDVKGHLIYEFSVLQPTTILELNMDTITITGITLLGSISNLPIPSQKLEKDLLTITFSSPLQANSSNKIEFQFKTKFSSSLIGNYSCGYRDNAGKAKRMAVTQFESCYARLAFPVVDQPNAKAVFVLKLLHPSGTLALSNMPVSSSINTSDNNAIMTVFEPSPKMSSYLLAWAVGEFDVVSSSCYQGKLPVNVYTMPGQIKKASFALRTAVECIEFLTTYTGIPIPVPKMDLLSIPDFNAGAMENWGLITFREVALLADEKQSTQNALSQVAYTVSHELVHQWAGNLVTPEWWDNLWLNEGFATFLGTLVIDALHPTWNVWDKFQSNYQGNAFSVDAAESTHAIQLPVPDAHGVDAIFDAISYEKSSAVLQMLGAYIGNEALRKGFSAYLAKFAYKCSRSEDLFAALGEAAGFSGVPQMMDSWVLQKGFPLVSIRQTKVDQGKGIYEYKLSQRRFYTPNLTHYAAELESARKTGAGIGTATTAELPDPTLYWIPLTLFVQWSVNGVAQPVQLIRKEFRTREDSLVLTPPTSTSSSTVTLDWLKLNANNTGFYRVYYEDETVLAALTPALKASRHSSKQPIQPTTKPVGPDALIAAASPASFPPSLSTADRLGVETDMSALSLKLCGALIPFPLYCSFARETYQDETSYDVWTDVLSNIGDGMNVFLEGLVNVKGKDNAEGKRLVKNYSTWRYQFIVPKAKEIGILDGNGQAVFVPRDFSSSSSSSSPLTAALASLDAASDALAAAAAASAAAPSSSALLAAALTAPPAVDDINLRQLRTLLRTRVLAQSPALVRHYVKWFDAVLLPRAKESAVWAEKERHAVETWERMKKTNDVGEPQLREEVATVQKTRVSVDDRLAEALLSIPTEDRTFVYIATTHAHTLLSPPPLPPSSTEDGGDTSASWTPSAEDQALAEPGLILERQAALLAIYHSVSPKTLPGDVRGALRYYYCFTQDEALRRAMVLLLEEDDGLGVMKQDLHMPAFLLGSLCSVGCAWRFWAWLSADGYSNWNRIRPRLKDMIQNFFLEYVFKNLVLTGTDEQIAQHRAEVAAFLAAQTGLSELLPKKILEYVDTNTNLYKVHGPAVLKWLEEL